MVGLKPLALRTRLLLYFSWIIPLVGLMWLLILKWQGYQVLGVPAAHSNIIRSDGPPGPVSASDVGELVGPGPASNIIRPDEPEPISAETPTVKRLTLQWLAKQEKKSFKSS